MPGEKKERKRAAISAARHENKPTEKSALMSRVCTAGCIAWVLPHPWKGRSDKFSKFRFNWVQNENATQVHGSILNNPKFCSLFYAVKIQHMKLERECFYEGKGEVKQFNTRFQHTCNHKLFCAAFKKK